MTCFSSLGKRLGASLAAALLFAVACAQVERDYDAVPSGGSGGMGADAGDNGEAGEATGGKGGSGTSGHGGASAGAAGAPEAGAGGVPPTPGVTLTVALDGNGAGIVASDLAGIDCGATCSADFPADTQVTLTATPQVGSVFAKWTGGGCTGTGTCVTTLSAATAVTATFTLTTPILKVTPAGTGTGTVTSDLSGINCGAICTAPYNYGTSVVLTPTPTAGSAFTGWTGACTGTGPCTVPVNGDVEVTATFDIIIPHITVSKTGTGLGTVTSAPAGISCGATCTSAFTYGQSVVLTATAGAGSVFAGWTGGGCSGTGTCTVSATADIPVSAAFTCSAGTTTYNYSGIITTFTVPACVTSLTIDGYGASGGGAPGYVGGNGAHIKGTFTVTGGTVLRVLAGGVGLTTADTTGQQTGGSGGGGTFVTTTTNSPLLVAGGGGGAGAFSSDPGAGLAASITTAGGSGANGIDLGGVNGAGGVTNPNGGYHGGTGGGGLLGSGVNNSVGGTASYGSVATPGVAFVLNGAGGTPSACGAIAGCLPGRVGGFGGGGAGEFTGGGGGGYSGGAGGDYTFTTPMGGGGGGGGSFILGTATAQLLVTGAGGNAGNGKVTFTW